MMAAVEREAVNRGGGAMVNTRGGGPQEMREGRDLGLKVPREEWKESTEVRKQVPSVKDDRSSMRMLWKDT